MGRKHQEPSAQLNEIAIQIEQLQRKESIIDYFHELSLEELMLLEEYYHKNIENAECRKVYPDGRKRVRIFSPRSFAPDLTTNSPQKRAIIAKIPEFAILPEDNIQKILDDGETIWKKSVVGLDEIYQKLLLHIINYVKTGTTRPILLVGVPGCGKSKVARVYGSIMGLQTMFIACPRMATSRGLYGDAPTYHESSCGAIIEAIIRSKTGNPVFVLDEIDKASPASFRGSCDMQGEALNLIDESAKEFVDNYLQCPVDVSHSPVILTANSLDNIISPLVDRCEVIDFPVPTKEHIISVANNAIIPELLKKLDCQKNVRVCKDVVIQLVGELYKCGAVSIRVYQSLFENAISSAYVRSVITGKAQCVNNKDIEAALNHTITHSKKKIGF